MISYKSFAALNTIIRITATTTAVPTHASTVSNHFGMGPR